MKKPTTGVTREFSRRQTSVRLGFRAWEALHDVARQKGCSVDDLVADVDRKRRGQRLFAAIINYVVAHYRGMLQQELADELKNDAERVIATAIWRHSKGEPAALGRL